MLGTMFERFTDRARRVVVLAQEEARLLGHSYIGTEHILLGLISEQDGVAANVLDRLGISAEAVRSKVESIIGEGSGAPSGHIPFTPRSKKVLELSLREALTLGHNYIGTEHVLLGLIREGDGVGAQVLVSLGAELSRVRQEVLSQLSGYRTGPGGNVLPSGLGRPRETPAAAKAAVEARRLAGSHAVGSQHYLLGLVQDENSMAAKALAELGVSREALEGTLAQIESTGTSDETPEEAGARRIGLRVQDKLVLLEIDDPDLAASLEKAMVGRKARIIRGTDPEAVGFPALWASVSRTVEDLTRRVGFRSATHGGTSAPAAPQRYWRPPALLADAHAGGYWIVSQVAGRSANLEVGPGVDRETLRAWLRELLIGRRSTLAGPEEETTAAVLWVAIDTAGDSFTVSSFGVDAAGPPDAVAVPLQVLVDVAIEDLSAVV